MPGEWVTTHRPESMDVKVLGGRIPPIIDPESAWGGLERAPRAGEEVAQWIQSLINAD